MRAELFWEAWGPICDFRRRLQVRVRRARRLLGTEQERRATLKTALRAWALTRLPEPLAVLPLVLWWPVGAPQEMFLPGGLAVRGVFRSAWAVEERESGVGYALLALADSPWGELAEWEETGARHEPAAAGTTAEWEGAAIRSARGGGSSERNAQRREVP
jgi:hypothetical protein